MAVHDYPLSEVPQSDRKGLLSTSIVLLGFTFFTATMWAGGTSHPATESQVAALKDTPYDTGLDLELLSEIADYFRDVRKKYHQFESEFTREDVSVQINQVPGGMMSNLANQLKEQNALDKIRDVFDEIPRVRADLGFPPLVTPTSQIVGTQAVYNIFPVSGIKRSPTK